MEHNVIVSRQDGLGLDVCIMEPKIKPKGIVQISHGMAEHKERYYPFMEFLNEKGYVCVIHDHRGHGKSVKAKEDYGYFYTEDYHYIVEDLFQVTEYVHDLYPDLDITLFSHSMGTMVARCYIQKYDKYLKNLVLCGPPTQNSMASLAVLIAKFLKPFFGEKKPNHLLNKMAFAGYGKGYSWLSKNEENIKSYEEDELCGYLFTTNGFINLFQLMASSFDKNAFSLENENLRIRVIAGSKDPVIQSEEKFYDLVDFIKGLGYKDVSSKLYTGLKHELLNEKESKDIAQDIYQFIENE